MAGHQEVRLADEELHDEVGAARRFELDRRRPWLTVCQSELLAGHRIWPAARRRARRRGRSGPCRHATTIGLDHRPAVDQPLERLGRAPPRPCRRRCPDPCNGSGDRARCRAGSRSSRARRTGSPIARAASNEVWAGFTTKSVKLMNSSAMMIATIRVGSDGEHAAQQHQPHVQARARRAAPAIEPDLGHPPAKQRHQRHGDHEVGDQQAGHPAARAEVGRHQAGQPGIGRGARHDGEHGQRRGGDAAASARGRRCSSCRPSVERPAKLSLGSPASADLRCAYHRDVEVLDLLAQRIAIEPQKTGGAQLVPARRPQRQRQQRPLDLGNDTIVHAVGRQPIAVSGEHRLQMAVDRVGQGDVARGMAVGRGLRLRRRGWRRPARSRSSRG